MVDFEDIKAEFDKKAKEKIEKWVERGLPKRLGELAMEQAWGWVTGFARKLAPDDVAAQKKFVRRNMERAISEVGREYAEGLYEFLYDKKIILPDPPGEKGWLRVEIPIEFIRTKFEEVI